MLVGECTRRKRGNVLTQIARRFLLQKYITLSTVPQNVEELLQIKIFLQTIMKRKAIKIKKEYAKHRIATQFFLDITKKKFVKVARGKDILNALCLGDGQKNRQEAKIYDNWKFSGICKKL